MVSHAPRTIDLLANGISSAIGRQKFSLDLGVRRVPGFGKARPNSLRFFGGVAASASAVRRGRGLGHLLAGAVGLVTPSRNSASQARTSRSRLPTRHGPRSGSEGVGWLLRCRWMLNVL